MLIQRVSYQLLSGKKISQSCVLRLRYINDYEIFSRIKACPFALCFPHDIRGTDLTFCLAVTSPFVDREIILVKIVSSWLLCSQYVVRL